MPLETRKRVKKLLFLYQGLDLKIDKDLRVRRQGTPVEDMVDDIPSPPPQKNSKSLALLKEPTVVIETAEIEKKDSDEPGPKIKSKKDFGVRDYLGEIQKVSFRCM